MTKPAALPSFASKLPPAYPGASPSPSAIAEAAIALFNNPGASDMQERKKIRAGIVAELRALPAPLALAVGYYMGQYTADTNAAGLLGRWMSDDL